MSASAWPKDIDPVLLERLMKPSTVPGIIPMAIVRRILGWAEYFSGRLPLVDELNRRRAQSGGLRSQEIPIVYGQWSLPSEHRAEPISSPPIRELLVVQAVCNHQARGESQQKAPSLSLPLSGTPSLAASSPPHSPRHREFNSEAKTFPIIAPVQTEHFPLGPVSNAPTSTLQVLPGEAQLGQKVEGRAIELPGVHLGPPPSLPQVAASTEYPRGLGASEEIPPPMFRVGSISHSTSAIVPGFEDIQEQASRAIEPKRNRNSRLEPLSPASPASAPWDIGPGPQSGPEARPPKPIQERLEVLPSRVRSFLEAHVLTDVVQAQPVQVSSSPPVQLVEQSQIQGSEQRQSPKVAIVRASSRSRSSSSTMPLVARQSALDTPPLRPPPSEPFGEAPHPKPARVAVHQSLGSAQSYPPLDPLPHTRSEYASAAMGAAGPHFSTAASKGAASSGGMILESPSPSPPSLSQRSASGNSAVPSMSNVHPSLANLDLESLVDKVQRKLVRRVTAERERKGGSG